MSKTLLAMIVDIVRWEEKILLKAAEIMGLNLSLVNLRSRFISLTEPPGNAKVYLIRAVSRTTAVTSALVIESFGAVTINSPRALQATGDKAAMIALLASRGVPVPRSYLALGKETALMAAEALGFPVVLKPVSGGWGMLSAKAGSPEELEQLLELKEAIPSPTSRLHVIQEYIEAGGSDYRVLVVGGEAVAAMKRSAVRGWKANVSRGALVEPISPRSEIEELAVRASEALGAEVAGVDIIDGDGDMRVLEVNGVPEFRGLREATGVPVERYILSYARENARR